MIDFPHKILVPRRSESLIPRPRLTELLNTIVDRKLITLSAPAGYGKTSLLTDFASAGPPLPICWYTLDRFDEDPWVFLGYLAAAIEQRFPGATQQTVATLAGRSHTSFATAMGVLVRDAYAIGADFTLIIDDWHLIDHVSDISELVAQLLHRCPNSHLILASRIYPSLPDMMLLAARRQMSGLDEELLRFTTPEVAAVLGAEYHTPVPLERVQALTAQTNGWITGILLALQATTPNIPSLAQPGGRAERQVYRFLAEQVFGQQPPEIRTFLLDSALLDELTPARCDALFERSDSGLLLDTLLRNHIFITEIKSGVFRYHPLFREFLHEHYRTLDPQRHRDMALRVADGYREQGQWPLAFDAYVTAGDLKAAQLVIAAGGEQLYAAGRLETLERWFSALPLDDLDAPLLCLKARVLLSRGQQHEAQILVDLATARMQPGQEPIVLLLQSHLARIDGRYKDALDAGLQALHSAQDMAHLASALRTIAICRHRLGQTAVAIEDLKEALAIERQRGDLHAMALLQQDLGICYQETGQLAAAEEYYSYADAYWATIGNAGLRSLSLNSKGIVQQLAGNYRKAHETFTTALQYARDAAVSLYQVTVLASLGDLYSHLQLWSPARAAYDQARRIGGSAYLISYLDLANIRLLVGQRQYEAAARTLQQLSDASLSHHSVAALLLRGSIACGLGNYGEAAQAAEQAIATAEQTNSRIDVVRACLLQAQVAARQLAGDSLLIGLLERAAQIADQIGHDAFLVAETLLMRGLLRHVADAGWARAAEWLQRHQDILLAAQIIHQNDDRPVLVVRTLGTDQILLDSKPAELGWHKAREVLYYLLEHPDGGTPEVLREAIWPDLSPERSRGAVKTAIYQLRSTLPRNLIELHGRQFYRLNRDAMRIEYDVERFLEILTTHADDPEALAEALDLYRGLYLPWSSNSWSTSIRSELERHYLHTLQTLAQHYERWHAYQEALTFYMRILSVDVLDEAAHAGVMRCQIALSNRAAAINQYHTLRRVLDEELGINPGQTSEAEQLYHRILAES